MSIHVPSQNEMEKAARMLDEQGYERGEVTDLGEDFRAYIMAFRDPDNIQLELTAPYE